MHLYRLQPCGLGEAMELAAERGFQVRGTELYKGYIDHCQGRGLDVIQGEVDGICIENEELACAGPQYARRDIQVSLAPSVSAHLCDVRLCLHRPRLPCVRNDAAHCAASMLPQWLYGAMRLLLRPSTRAYLVLRALASLSLARSG